MSLYDEFITLEGTRAATINVDGVEASAKKIIEMMKTCHDAVIGWIISIGRSVWLLNIFNEAFLMMN